MSLVKHTMMNLAMRRALEEGSAIDVSGFERTFDGNYILPTFEEDFDYCDAKSEDWIWLIARLEQPMKVKMADSAERTLPTGTFIASTTAKFYDPHYYICVWLR